VHFVNARVPGISISRRKRAGEGERLASRCIHQTVIPFRFCRVAGGPRAMKSRIANRFSLTDRRQSRLPRKIALLSPRHGGHARRRARTNSRLDESIAPKFIRSYYKGKLIRVVPPLFSPPSPRDSSLTTSPRLGASKRRRTQGRTARKSGLVLPRESYPA